MKTGTKNSVLILGISNKDARYSNMAYKLLLENGFNNLFGVAPNDPQLDSIKYYKSLDDVKDKIHTLTVYISPERSKGVTQEIIKLKPERIVMNPGAENDDLKKKAEEEGIEVLYACTLVLLRTNQF